MRSSAEPDIDEGGQVAIGELRIREFGKVLARLQLKEA